MFLLCFGFEHWALRAEKVLYFMGYTILAYHVRAQVSKWFDFATIYRLKFRWKTCLLGLLWTFWAIFGLQGRLGICFSLFPLFQRSYRLSRCFFLRSFQIVTGMLPWGIPGYLHRFLFLILGHLGILWMETRKYRKTRRTYRSQVLSESVSSRCTCRLLDRCIPVYLSACQMLRNHE